MPLAPRPAPGSTTVADRPLLWIYAVAAAVVAADQLSKAWVLYGLELPDRLSQPLALGVRLTMVWNRGFSFGLMASHHEAVRWGLAAFSLGVAAALSIWAWRIRRPLLGAGVALVIGGALGNLIDRVRFGAVADFLDFSAWFFPYVFNVADSAITVGVALLLLDSLMQPSERTRPAS